MRSAVSASESWKLSWIWSRPGLDQADETLAVQRHARGDQIAIEPGGGGVAHQLLEIAPGGGLAAGEVNMQGAEGRGLVDDALPDRGAQLVAGGGKLQRIGAIGALQGAAVRQLGEHADRVGDGALGSCPDDPRLGQDRRPGRRRRGDDLAIRLIAGGERIDDGAHAGWPSPSRTTATAISSRLMTRSGASTTAIPYRVELQTYPRGQSRQILPHSTADLGAFSAPHPEPRPRRRYTGLDISVVKRIELRPQYVAFEDKGLSTACC